MWKKLGRLIINNFGLKVLAVVFAVILWLVIVNTEDPEKAATFTVPIEIVNANYLTEEGLTYEILDNVDTISFTVSGKRSIVENLTADDFLAVANMENIDESMTMVPISLTPTSYNSQLEITRRQSYLMVSVEPLVTREFEVNVAVEGSPVGSYFVEGAEASPASVTVEGAQSAVEEINAAWTSISVRGAEETFSEMEDVFLVSESGNIIDNENLILDFSQVEVTADILLEKTVPVELEVTGEPAEGYIAGEPEYELDTLTIAGLAEVLDGIDELTLSSPKLSIEGATEDQFFEIDPKDLSLPDGVVLSGEEQEAVAVRVPIQAVSTREVEMPAKNIAFEGLAEDLTATVSIDPVMVRITGPEETIDSVDGSKMNVTVDATGIGVGNRRFDIELETDGDYTAEATFSVSFTEKEEEEESTGLGLFGALGQNDTEEDDTED